MDENYIRQTIVYGNHFWDFYNAQTLEVQKKIDWVIGLVRTLQVIPVKFFKHIEGTDGLYEMRIKVGSDIYRVFCCLQGKPCLTFQWISEEIGENAKTRNRESRKIKTTIL